METGEIERQDAAHHRVRDAGEGQKAIAKVIEQAVERPGNQNEADGHNNLQTFLGFLKISELARPDQPVSGRKFHVVRDAPLSLLDRAAQVTAAHAELDRDEALHALVINPGGSRVQGDVRQFAEGYVGIGAGGGLIAHFDIANFIDAVAVFGRITDDQIELPVTLQDRSRYGAAHGRLHDRVHIAGIEAIARGLGAIHFDVQIGLSQDGEDAEVGDAPHLAHLVPDLVGKIGDGLEIGTDDLDRINTFDARDPFLDIVLNVLGEIEDDPRKLVIKLLLNLVGEFVFGQTLWPFIKRLEGSEEFDVGEGRSVAAVVRPAMLGNHGEDFVVSQKNMAHFSGGRFAVLERERDGHGSPDPKVAFFQVRKKLAAEPRCDQEEGSQR